MVLEIATPLRARNDMVIDGGSFFLGRAMVRDGRRGQCHTPYEIDAKIPFCSSQYAEREPATSREGPMVLFDHRPARTNCQRRLAAKRTAAFAAVLFISNYPTGPGLRGLKTAGTGAPRPW